MRQEASEQMIRLVSLRREVATLEAELGLDPAAAPPSPLPDENAYALVSELTTDLISIHGPTGEYLFVSRNAEQFFGWTKEDLVGRSAYDFFHPDDVTVIAADHAAQRSGDARNVRYRLRAKDGAYRWVETRSRSRLTPLGVAQVVAVTRDIHSEEIARQRAEQVERVRLADLERLAQTDPLTSMPNRRHATDTLEREVQRSHRHALALSVVLLDLDHFKSINDRFGHQLGDRVLCAVAGTLRSSLRREDLAARWGGEEFIVVLPSTGLEAALECAERLRSALDAIHVHPLVRITASAGVAALRPAEGGDELIRRADVALYAAKAGGRNSVVPAGEARVATLQQASERG